MITVKKLLDIEKNDLQDASKTIKDEDLQKLVEWLAEKNDKIRYQALLLLLHRSEHSIDVYRFWDTFCEKLKSNNSYQRSIGLMLIAENAKWDEDNKIDYVIDDFLSLLYDEKNITVRQCIQSLNKIVPYKSHLHKKIANELMAVDISKIKETMQKLILIDILSILALINKHQRCNEIESYILDAKLSGLLDKKSLKQIEGLL